MIGAGLLGAQGGGQGACRQALGEDLAGARLAGGGGISREIRPAEGSRQARLQPGRLRLHHLHRQFRAAAAGEFQGDQRWRSGRRRRALRQPQFRGPRQRRRARQLSRLAAAGGRLFDRRLDERRHGQGAARHRRQGQEGVSQGHLADQQGNRRLRRQERHAADVRQEIRRRVQGRRQLAQDQRQRRHDLRLGQEVDLRAEPALFRRHEEAAGAARRHRRRARARAVPRFDHHRPHLAGRLDQDRLAGRQISRRPQGQAGRLQPIRHAARQPRSDDARHLRQYPHQEPDGAGRRRRLHRALSVASSACRSTTRP